MPSNESLQQLVATLREAFRRCWVFVVLVSLVLFSIFFVIGVGSIAEDALETDIADRLVVSVFLKPGQTLNKETLQRVRTLSGIKSIELLPPDMARAIIAQRTGDVTGALTRGISPDVFPLALLIQVQREHLSRVPEILTDLKINLPAIQEIRYPRESLQQVIQTMTMLNRAVRQLTILMSLIAAAACLSGLALVVHDKHFWFQYSLSGLIAGGIAGILLCWTSGMIEVITGWSLEFPDRQYMYLIGAGMAVGGLGDIFSKLAFGSKSSVHDAILQIGTPETPEI